MSLTRKFLACLFVVSSSVVRLPAYDEVKLDKIIPLVAKKASPSLLHLDQNKQAWILNGDNQSLEMIGSDGKAVVALMPGKKASSLFKEAVDFGFLSDGSMVIADAGNDRICVIGPESKSETTSAKDWKKSKLLWSFPAKGVSALAVSKDDVIALGYDGQAGIDVFSVDGVLLHRLFPSEKFSFKKIVAMAYSANGQLLALDDGKSVLHRFSDERKWLGATDGFEGGRSVAVDDYGYAYVALSSGRWKEVNPEGAISGTFGTKGKNPGEMLSPFGIAAPDATHVWVAETGNNRIQSFQLSNLEKRTLLVREPAAHVQVRMLSQWEDQVERAVIGASGDILLLKNGGSVFEWVDQQGAVKSSWKKKGKGNLGFARPSSMTTDASGKIWVSDEGDHSLKVVSEKGDIEKTLGQKGKKEGALKGPNFLSVRADGSVVVSDKGNSRVQVLSPNGLFLFQVGSSGKKEGQFSDLAGLASNQDLIALLDGGRKSLIFYNASGKFVSEISNKEGKSPYWSEPSDIAVDSGGRFFVLDNGSKRVRIFNRKGQFLADFTAKGHRIACGPGHEVLTIDEKAVSLFSVHQIPRAVQNIAAAEVEGDLQVSWEPNYESKEYAIYRSSGAAYTLLTKVEASPFSDRTSTPGINFTYSVVGLNENGQEGNWAVSKPIKAPKRRDVSLISIQKIDLKPVFTAACKYYVNHPIGTITIRNNDDKSFRGIKLALGLKKYCDFPTEIVVPDLAAGEEKAVPVTITFNDSIFELTEDTPVQMDVRLSYFEDNLEKSISQNAPISLYSRNAISWAEKGRVSSFITPKDPPVVEFSRAAIRDQMALLKGSTVTKPLAKAALFYEALNALGISYVPDPKTPFAEASSNPDVLDYVQYPRETLARKTGDCDDTTALMAALLESVGVSVALIDMPTHILLMADTGESDISVIGLPEERFVKFQGTYWVPIETTRLGQNFLAAWQSGAARVKDPKVEPNIQYIPVSQAADKYPPVTLVEEAKGVPAYPAEKVAAAFPGIMKQLQAERYEAKIKEVKDRIKADPVNHMLQIELGMVYVEGGHPEEGKQTFIALLKEDESVEVQAAARNNLGNLAYLDGNYKEAATHYEKALGLSSSDGGILVNMGRTSWRLGDKAASMKYLDQAKAVLPEWRDFTSDIPAEYLPK